MRLSLTTYNWFLIIPLCFTAPVPVQIDATTCASCLNLRDINMVESSDTN